VTELLATEPIQRAIAAALAMNEDGSTGENQNNRSINQTELPSSVTTPTADAPPLLRMQHKLLDQAQTRLTTSLVAAAPSQTNERHLDEDWGAEAVALGHGVGESASTENEATECCICLDARATHIFVPCGHVCICKECKTPYKNGTKLECPMCRKEFTTVIKAFF